MADSVSSNKKRRLADMNADEFMKHGFDSDLSLESEDEEGEEKLKPSPTKAKSKTSKHKMQLSSLEEKDPEFYNFLKENDQELLKFNDSDTDDDGEDSTDNDEEEKVEIDQESEFEANLELEDQDEEQIIKKGKLVTMEMVKKWNKELEKMTLSGLRQVIKAFRAAVHGALDDLSTDDNTALKQLSYRVEGNTVFNAIVQLCLKHVHVVLQHHVGGSSTKHGKLTLPSSNKKWTQVKNTLKNYLNDLLQLLRTLTEPSMLCVLLKHTHQLIPYYVCFPKISKTYIKRMIRMWGTGSEHVRVLAFLGVNKVMALLPSTLIEFCLKQLYMAFVRNTKFTSPRTQPLITFMQNSLVEVFRLDPHVTYQHAFVYIRQLAIHLRNAILNKKKDSFQSVYNWQYVHCIHLWCRVLSEVHCQGVLDPLIYPLVQVVIGVIKLLPTARYYPLRFHCIRSLNLLSKAKDTYIPTAPFLLQILDTELNKKIKMSTAKPLDFSYILKVSKSSLHTKPFEDAVMDNIFELLLEFFSAHAHSISFPEIVLPTVIRLRKFIKTTKVPKYRKQIKQLLEKIEETSTEVTDRRSTVSFSPKDIKQVESWTAQYKQEPNTIVKFYNTWKTMKPVLAAPQEGETNKDYSELEREDEEPKTKRQKKSRKEGDKRDKKQKKSQQKGENLLQQHNQDTPDPEDIVEDFQFSSDED